MSPAPTSPDDDAPETSTPDTSTAGPAATAAADVASAAPESAELPADIAALSYEQARDQLVEVVQRLETGTAELEESIRLWERGEALAVRCQQWLDGARERLDRATATE